MNDWVGKLDSISTEVAILVVVLAGAWVLGAESRELLMTALGGLLGYLTRGSK